jgi:hypothetical protein
MDLDPDKNGTKGQIINFGRDEENMIVLSNSLHDFFNFLLVELQKENNPIQNSKTHLYDILRKLKRILTHMLLQNLNRKLTNFTNK